MAERKRTDKDRFTATEVGALIEELRSEFRTVVDIAREVKTDVEALKAEFGHVKTWTTRASDEFTFIRSELVAIRADLKTFDERLRLVEAKLSP